MSVCSLFFTLSSYPSFVLLPWVSRVTKSGCVQLRSAGPLDKHYSPFWILFAIPFAISYLSPCSFLFFIHSATKVFPNFSSLKHTFFRHWLNKKSRFSLQLLFNAFCPFVAQDKADLLLQNWAFCVSSLFSMAPVVLVLYCEPQPCDVLSSLLFPSLISFCLHFSSLIISSLNRPLSAFLHRSGCSGRSMVPSVQGSFHSQTSHHRHAELTRGE